MSPTPVLIFENNLLDVVMCPFNPSSGQTEAGASLKSEVSLVYISGQPELHRLTLPQKLKKKKKVLPSGKKTHKRKISMVILHPAWRSSRCRVHSGFLLAKHFIHLTPLTYRSRRPSQPSQQCWVLRIYFYFPQENNYWPFCLLFLNGLRAHLTRGCVMSRTYKNKG